jgi:four helix bundle protein
MTVRHYQELVAWQRAMDMVVGVYRVTKQFPREEIYGLTSQLRRAAVSVPSNIAEGQGRWGTGEFIQFLGIAHGSLQEAETQLLIAVRLLYVTLDEVKATLELIAETGRLINGLHRSLQASH